MLVVLEDLCEQTVMGLGLEENIDQISHKEDDSHSTRDLERFAGDLTRCQMQVGSPVESGEVDCGKNKAHYYH
jgi:hypothetical protein